MGHWLIVLTNKDFGYMEYNDIFGMWFRSKVKGR